MYKPQKSRNIPMVVSLIHPLIPIQKCYNKKKGDRRKVWAPDGEDTTWPVKGRAASHEAEIRPWKEAMNYEPSLIYIYVYTYIYIHIYIYTYVYIYSAYV